MWDDPVPVGRNNEPSVDESDPAAHVAWTDGQIMRLENEWRRAQRSFAYHPVIGVAPLRGDPPHEYQIDYRVRTLVMNDAGELQYVDDVAMHMWLPPGFPNQPPVMRPMANVFHPNIALEGVYLTRPWHANDSLVDFVARIGELLAYRSYDPESVVNSVAMDWLTENSGMLPLDNRADFSPYAGGEPLGRIHRMGPETLDQIRRALDDMRYALLAEEGAPTAADVEDFARKTRAATSLFLDGDVADRLREQASECDDFCRELPLSTPLWEYLRAARAAAGKADFAAQTLRNSAAAFGVALAELQAMVRPEDVKSPETASRLIPAMSKLQPLQMKLPPLVRDFEQRAADVRGLLEAMRQPVPEVNVSSESTLGKRLAAQSETIREAVVAEEAATASALSEVEPLLRRAKPELAALEQIVAWREYMDMFGKAKSIEKQLAEWGSAGVHAFYMSNPSGSFGPFQFEEALDLGGARIVVRNPEGSQIEVLDAFSQNTLGKSSTGALTIVLGQGPKKPGHQTSFRLTGRCDDLAIQFDFIQKHTLEAMPALQRPINGATSWCGVMSRLLADLPQQKSLRDSHRKVSHRWKAIMTDLVHLLKFKERLSTYHLLARMNDEVPRVKEMIGKVELRMNDATDKVQAIMGKSSRNVETDQLVVPPKLVEAYSTELRKRDVAKHEIARLNGVLKQIARELGTRLASVKQCGSAEIAPFRSLAAFPETIADVIPHLTDEALRKQVAKLEELLNVKLPSKAIAPPPPAAAPGARPAQPTIGPAAAAKDLPPGSKLAEKPAAREKEAGAMPSPVAPSPVRPPHKPRRPIGPPAAVDPMLPRMPAAAPAATADPAAQARAPEPKKPMVLPTPQPIGEPMVAGTVTIFSEFAEESAAKAQPAPEPGPPDDELLLDLFGGEEGEEDQAEAME